MNAHCQWKHPSNGPVETSCGKDFAFIEGDASDNGFAFCPYCGKKIESIRLCWACSEPALDGFDQCAKCTEDLAE